MITVYHTSNFSGEDHSNFLDGLRNTINSTLKARQKRKQTEANAQLAAAKGLAKSSPSINIPNIPSALMTDTKKPAIKKDNTWLYVGIGVAVLALGVGAYFLIKKK